MFGKQIMEKEMVNAFNRTQLILRLVCQMVLLHEHSRKLSDSLRQTHLHASLCIWEEGATEMEINM